MNGKRAKQIRSLAKRLVGDNPWYRSEVRKVVSRSLSRYTESEQVVNVPNSGRAVYRKMKQDYNLLKGGVNNG